MWLKVFLSVSFLGISATSFATGHHGMDPSCRDEAKKICPNMKPGDGLFKCIHDNKSKFSAGCQAKLDEKKEKMQAVHDACKADREKFCPGMKVGDGKLGMCMKEHMAEVSAGCKASWAPKKIQ